MDNDRAGEVYEELRPLLLSIAYRMLGSVSEAEDVVQEAFLRFHRAAPAEVMSPRAYLTTVTTRLALDELRSARARREQYVGEWLPEPVLADPGGGVADRVELAESLSMAFLVVLDTLSPIERAVFLLHEVFGYAHAEIAEIVEKSEANCRQIASRARRHVDARRPRFASSLPQREHLARRFIAAAQDGDIDALVQLLASDASLHGDGGGKAPAVTRPIRGRERVARVVAGLTRQARRMGLRQRPTTVNGQPGAVYLDKDDRLINVIALDVTDSGIRAVRSIVNPDKLRHLAPLGDINALMSRR